MSVPGRQYPIPPKRREPPLAIYRCSQVEVNHIARVANASSSRRPLGLPPCSFPTRWLRRTA
eukprot:10255190-Alexandrium_andersonii.AAC.1